MTLDVDCVSLDADYNVIVGNGQSLMQGMEAWPALSLAAQPGNAMLGQSTRPAEPDGPTFTPIGGDVLTPLVATNQDNLSGLLLDAQAAAGLPAGSCAFGESPLESLTNGLQASTHRRFVALNVAVSGSTLEQLSKGAVPEKYNRYVQALERMCAIARGEGASVQVAVVALAQGEHNCSPDFGGDASVPGYEAKFLQWVDDHAADAVRLTGQQNEPLFLTYQTGGTFTRDAEDLSVGMAQWQATKKRKNLHMVGPVYPVTSKSGHLDANGSRWLGLYYAKAARHVFENRRPWRPLEPVEVSASGECIFVKYRVPHPPLRLGECYAGNLSTLLPHRGFYVRDSVGPRWIEAVDIVADDTVRITLGFPPSGNTLVYYGRQADGGVGNVCDSDPSVSSELYTYLPGSGMYPSADIEALRGKGYPLANWSIAFCLPVGFTELSPS